MRKPFPFLLLFLSLAVLALVILAWPPVQMVWEVYTIPIDSPHGHDIPAHGVEFSVQAVLLSIIGLLLAGILRVLIEIARVLAPSGAKEDA
jgi:hypothetical protein